MTVYDPSNKAAEIRVSKRKLTIYGTVFAVMTIGLCVFIAGLRGYDHNQSSIWDFPVAIALFIPIIVVHEMVHASAALLFGYVKPKDISFRIVWKAMAPACNIKTPVTVKAFRVIAIAPFCVTTPFGFLVLLMYPSHVTAMLAGMTIVGCAGDFIMLWKLIQFKQHQLVVDPPHSSFLGFDVYDIDNAECGLKYQSGSRGCLAPSPHTT